VKVTLFTSNQPRHVALVEALAGVADEVLAVQECTTVFPGQVPDFYRKSEVMQAYFQRMMAAEREVFGRPRFCPGNARSLALKMGDLNRLALETLAPALASDVYVVFGASYVRGDLIDFLVAHGAVNIHMGVSPYYRGSATNFWALYDGRPQYVGATIHMLSKGLDSGPMLFHALPPAEATDPFLLGMKAVRSAHAGLLQYLQTGALQRMEPAEQDKTLELRYSRYDDFTDEVAEEYLGRLASPYAVRAALAQRDLGLFLRPFVG